MICILEIVTILLALEMILEALPEVPSEEKFSLKVSIPLVLQIKFVIVDNLRKLEEELGFKCSFLVNLGTMPWFASWSHQNQSYFQNFC